MKEFNKVIFGATALSAGLSVNLSENDLIIEKNIFSGAEFAQSFNAKPIKDNSDYCNKTKELLSELKSRNILGSDGCYSALPLSGCLSAYLLKSKAAVLLDCVVTSISKTDAGFIIEYFGENGFSEVFAKIIIDTTDAGIFKGATDYPYDYNVGIKKYYIANLDGYNGSEGDFNIIKGHLKNEYYLKISADNMDLTDARLALIKIAEQNKFKIASFAYDFAYDYKKAYKTVRTRNYYFIPSASFNNFADAFDFGVKEVNK